MSWLRWFLLFCFLAAAVLSLYNYVCFHVLPRLASRLSHGRQRDGALRLLECLAWLPGPISARVQVHYRLGVAYFIRRRLDDAERQFRLVLEAPVTPGTAADVHRRLSDVLEAQGRDANASREFGRAADLASRKSDVTSLIVQAELLERSHQYAQALATYETALRSAQALPGPTQGEIMVKIGLAAFHDGQPDLTITWMERAIAAKPQNIYLRQAHSMAGVAHGDQAHFAPAISHSRQAAALAERDGAHTEVGRALGMIANYQKNQGDLVRALETCAEIERRGWTNRTSLFMQADCLEALGKYEDANKTFGLALHFDEIDQPHIPHYRRRQDGIVSLGIARNLALQDQATQAWECLQDAVIAFQGDDKLTFMCDGFAAWILALLGRQEKAESKVALVESGLGRYSQDRNWKMGGLSMLGRAQYALGDYASAAERWQAYLDAGPNPVWQPRGYFFLGDCLERLGDIDGARRAYQQAICVPIADADESDAAWPPTPSLAAGHETGRFVDTHEARLARQRLEGGQ